MANDLTTTGSKPISTPEGVQALRSIASSPAWGEDDPAEAKRWLSAAAVERLPLAKAEARCALVPATLGDARRFLGPTLSLVAPAGMSEGDQAAWLAAALDTLSGIPADLLERGCRAARRVADHPSKIIASIFAEIGGAWERRKQDMRNVEMLAAIASGAVGPTHPWERSPEPSGPTATPEEIAAIKVEVGLDTQPYPDAPKERGPMREPTAAALAEVAKAIGLDPTKPAVEPAFDPRGMSIAEIFAKRDQLRAEALAKLAERPAGAVPLDQRPMPDWEEMELYGT